MVCQHRVALKRRVVYAAAARYWLNPEGQKVRAVSSKPPSPWMSAVDVEQLRYGDWPIEKGVVYNLTCALCGHLFLYRTSNRIDESRMRPADRICRTCFPEWWRNWTMEQESPEQDAGTKPVIRVR
jgi:hypothetical protein